MPPAAHRASHEFADAHAGGHRLETRVGLDEPKISKEYEWFQQGGHYATKPKLHAQYFRGNPSIKFTIYLIAYIIMSYLYKFLNLHFILQGTFERREFP